MNEVCVFMVVEVQIALVVNVIYGNTTEMVPSGFGWAGVGRV